MPFTASHAVVALPFLRTPLVPAAIAIGAMTPDLPLFLRGVGVSYGFTHAPVNVIWTALIALGLFLLWRCVLRSAASELSPMWLARRLPEDWNAPAPTALREALGIAQRWTHALWLAASLVIGVLSHILWDAFTHAGRVGTQLLPGLNAQWGPLLGFKWLQHGSSVAGLLIIGVWALIWLRRADRRGTAPRRLPAFVRVLWWISLPAMLIAAWVIGYLMLGPFNGTFTFQHLAYRTLPPACGVWAVLTLVLCIIIAMRANRRPTAGAPRS